MRENGMGDIGVIKGGGACLAALVKGRRVIGEVVEHRGNTGLGVYWRGEGGEIVNTSKQMHDMTTHSARGVLTRYKTILAKREDIRESILGVRHFRTREMEGDGSTYAVIEPPDRRMEIIFRIIVFF